jgi:SAM-dependent methyltransferase
MKEMNLTPEELQLSGVPLYQLRMARDVIGYRPVEGLKEAYLQYVKEISNQEWTISWELCVYLDKLVRALKPKRILDLGSGFSSFLFRSTNAKVVTIDTDPSWLEKTKQFLTQHNLRTDDMYLLDEASDLVQEPYDLILHDVGIAEKDRAPMFPLLNSKVIILDDMHIAEYRVQAMEFFKSRTIFDLQDDTKDAYNRYACMITP